MSDSDAKRGTARSRRRWRARRVWFPLGLGCALAIIGLALILLLRGQSDHVSAAIRIQRFTSLLTGSGGAYMRTVGEPEDPVVDEWLDFNTDRYKQNPDVESDFQLMIVSDAHETSTYNAYGKLVETRTSEPEDRGLLARMHTAAEANAMSRVAPIADSGNTTSVELHDPRKLEAQTLVVAIDDQGIPHRVQARADGEASPVYKLEKFKKLSRSEARTATRLDKLPEGAQRSVSRKVSRDELRDYRGFETYWLGARVPAGAVTDMKYFASAENAPHFYVAYGTEDDPYQVELNQWSADSEDGKGFWSVTDGVARATVNGHPAKLVKEGGELVIKVDGTVIDISGADAEELLALARRQLRRP